MVRKVHLMLLLAPLALAACSNQPQGPSPAEQQSQQALATSQQALQTAQQAQATANEAKAAADRANQQRLTK